MSQALDFDDVLNPRKQKQNGDRKVVIVGAGNVGATTAYALLLSGLTDDIVLVDIDKQRAEGQVLDLNHGMPFTHPTRISVGDLKDCRNAAAVVITAGANQRPGETRLDLAQKNTAVFKKMIPEISACNPRFVLVVTNPVDVLTYLTLRLSNLPSGRVIGSGTVLDTARFRYLIGTHCDVSPGNVHGYIVGEHGDSEVALWSQVTIAGLSFAEYCQLNQKDQTALKDHITRQVKTAAYEIISRKGATNFAVGMAVVRILTSILRNENRILTISAILGKEYGIEDVCLSVPAVLNRQGVSRLIPLRMNEQETQQFLGSASVLRKSFQDLL